MPMSTDTKVGLGIAAASAFAQLFAAKKAANAAKDAAKLQTDATDRAQAFNERVYADQQRNYAPYQAAGVQSLADLQNRLYGGQSMADRVNGYVQNAQAGLPPAMGGGGQRAPQAPQGMSLAQAQQAAAAPTQPPLTASNPDPTAFTQGLAQRGGTTGGVWKGAAQGAAGGAIAAGGTLGTSVALGALYGGIMGAVNKHAKTAPTDYTVADATKAITDAYTTYNGRPPAVGEVDAILKGQGWKPGDRYVGSGGLTSVLNALRSNAQGGAPAAPANSLAAAQQQAPGGVMNPGQLTGEGGRGVALGGPMVLMVGPDGSRQSVPAANVQEAMRRGAQMVQ